MVIIILAFSITLSVILKSLVSRLAYKKDHPLPKVTYFDCIGQNSFQIALFRDRIVLMANG